MGQSRPTGSGYAATVAAPPESAQTPGGSPSLRLALCQLDIRVGAIDHNVDLVLAALAEAQAADCDLAVFPELALVGYPPEDLVYKWRFIEDNKAALARVAAATTTCAAIVGYVEGDQNQHQESGQPYLWNAAAICAEGQVQATYFKQELPNYAVFDEDRYFIPGEDLALWSVNGVNIGCTICEDMWVDGGPCDSLAQGGAQVMININASPYRQGKLAARDAVLQDRIAAGGVPFVYLNIVGAQDELVFDGASVVVDATGELIARSKQFEEEVMIADFAVSPPVPATLPVVTVTAGQSVSQTGLPPKIQPLLDPMEELWQALVLGTRDYVHNNGFTDICFGLSGGIDSAMVACIAADALGPEHVHAVLMPSRFSSDHSVNDSVRLSENLGINHRTIAIEPAHHAFLDMLAPSFEGREPDVTEENLQSRIRGVLLMALSNKNRWLVLTTGNKSELAVGYSTLYGDTAGAYGVIKDVWKLTVYELARHFNRRRGAEVIPEHIITKPPSAELRPDQRDDQSLPPYEVLDPILIELVEKNRTAAELIEEGFGDPAVDPAVIMRLARLVDIAEFKRRQNPLGTRVSSKAFGRDRRMPITHSFRGAPANG